MRSLPHFNNPSEKNSLRFKGATVSVDHLLQKRCYEPASKNSSVYSNCLLLYYYTYFKHLIIITPFGDSRTAVAFVDETAANSSSLVSVEAESNSIIMYFYCMETK